MSYRDEGRPLYRSRKGIIFGVCRGLADQLEVSANMIRFGAIILMLVTGFWPMAIAYVVAALFIKPEPVIPFENTAEAEFYNSYTSSRAMALDRLKRTFDNLDRRIQRMEHIVTDREYDWDERLRRG